MKCKFLSALPQYIAPQRLLTCVAGWFGNCRWPWLKNILIRYFINKYNVDINLATLNSIHDYPTFNSFFTRHLRPELRPIDHDTSKIISPVDGCVSEIGVIHQNTLIQAKGHSYELSSLLGGSQDLAKLFKNGAFTTLYLAPKDYHRVHMPFKGTLRDMIYIPGCLFSVSQKTVQAIPNLFTRNERLVCLFDTALGPMAVILVGAMLVGSMEVSWDAKKDKSPTLGKGAELGHFKMGSTVILLFPENTIQWDNNLVQTSDVCMGQSIATRIS